MNGKMLKRHPELNYFLLIFAVCAALYVWPGEVSASRVYNPARYCLSNLKTIEGAIELYLMENTCEVSSVDMLVKNQYLKSEPRCSAAKSFYVFEKSINNSNFKEFYKIVKCPSHGFYLEDKSVFDQEQFHAQKYNRERRAFFAAVTSLIALLTLWQLVVLLRTQRRTGPASTPSGGRAAEETRPGADDGTGRP
ncbi:MAG: hypothetical protein A2008_02915 [Candidatus Wallbacteria bacterium GWC2_49_35]|uniref:Uncharacterized protein n=1 Tax=Candidatus Wallbacteria bacterium GWC2_49_35 TaxID=1817813 RepID=A0A1F7WMF0_9BACT|nr:MAG: hypothetical protein A2008_02915 [Candidatus Wallbacteria bacterium GWC2_49_35]HBC76377.1 hypothetical protein [Candidatus Wallbacteria bacterium]